MLAGKTSSLARHLPKRIYSAYRLMAEVAVFGLQQRVDLVKIDRVEVGQVRTLSKNGARGVYHGDSPPRFVMLDGAPEATAGHPF